MTHHEWIQTPRAIALARAFCRYSGQRGTDKQIAPLLARTPREALERMCAERGLIVTLADTLRADGVLA
jgi:hypothetical protein